MNNVRIGLIWCVLLAGVASARAETLSLSECLQLARQANPTLQTQKLEPLLAAEQVRESRSAYLPQIDLTAGYTAQADPQQVLIAGRAEPTQDQNYAHLSLSAEQLLYDFGRSSARVSGAQDRAAAAGADLAAGEQDLSLKTIGAYFQVLEAEQLLESARQEVEQVEEHRRVAAALFEQGVVTRNDLLQAEVRLAASRQAQLLREGGLDNAWLGLNYLTGRPAGARAELAAQEVPEEPEEPADTLLDRRPELLAQRQRLAAAEAGVEEGRSGYRPEIFARLGADYVENSFVKEQTIYRATLGLRVNLFDGQATTSRLRQALLVRDREQQRLRDLRARAELEYRQARIDARVARRRIEVAETAIHQAEENLRINRDRYREQVGTATEVLDAQTLLTRSRTDLALARFDYQVAVARVQRAAGNL